MRLRFRRELGISNVREQARLKLGRLDVHVRGSYQGSADSSGGLRAEEARYAARQHAYEASQGFTGVAGWPRAGRG